MSHVNIHGEPVGWCDCCTHEKPRVLRHGWVHGIETSFCAECAGGVVCDLCGDDIDYYGGCEEVRQKLAAGSAADAVHDTWKERLP